MKTFFYTRQRKRRSHTIKFIIYRIVKNRPTLICGLKEDGRGYRGDHDSVCYALLDSKEITAGELSRHLNGHRETAFRLFEILSD